MNILNEEQLDTFMDTIKAAPIWHDFFYTELTTGLRRGEICGLMWTDFDDKTGTLQISRTLHREKGGRLVAGDTKTYAGTRKIVLPPSTVELLAQAGLPSIRFHDLRHTFSTHALASGVDAKTLSGILGHTKASFTLDTYTHTTGDMQKRASEVVGDFLTDIFGEELRPWEESAKAARVLSD